MSKSGQLLRGQKWYSKRDRDGNLPTGIKNDPAKMCDVTIYLDSIKTEQPQASVSEPEAFKSKSKRR